MTGWLIFSISMKCVPNRHLVGLQCLYICIYTLVKFWANYDFVLNRFVPKFDSWSVHFTFHKFHPTILSGIAYCRIAYCKELLRSRYYNIASVVDKTTSFSILCLLHEIALIKPENLLTVWSMNANGPLKRWDLDKPSSPTTELSIFGFSIYRFNDVVVGQVLPISFKRRKHWTVLHNTTVNINTLMLLK